MQYFVWKTYINFIHKFHKFMLFLILKNLSFIRSCNCNLTDFFKLRNFYYDLVRLKRRPHNHKNKNVEEKWLDLPGKCFSQNVASPPLKAKTVIPQGAVFEKFVPSQLKGRTTLRSISLIVKRMWKFTR